MTDEEILVKLMEIFGEAEVRGVMRIFSRVDLPEEVKIRASIAFLKGLKEGRSVVEEEKSPTLTFTLGDFFKTRNGSKKRPA